MTDIHDWPTQYTPLPALFTCSLHKSLTQGFLKDDTGRHSNTCLSGGSQEANLADAQQRFQQEQAAAREALHAFAPGFGAGKLLADAMARRAAKV